MSVLTVTEDNFNALMEGDKAVVLDFWATWCGPCRSFAPVFEAAAREHPDMVFGKVDTDAEQNLASAFGIRSVPTLMVIREKVLVYRESGALPASTLAQVLAEVQQLDMEEVRRAAADAGDGD